MGKVGIYMQDVVRRFIIICLLIVSGLGVGQSVYDVKLFSKAQLNCGSQLTLSNQSAGSAFESVTGSVKKLCFELSYFAGESQRKKKIVFSVSDLPPGLYMRISELSTGFSEAVIQDDFSNGLAGTAISQTFDFSSKAVDLIRDIQEIRVEDRRFMIELSEQNGSFATAFNGGFSLKLEMVDQ